MQAPAVVWVDLALVHSLETQGARMEKYCLLHRGAAAVIHMVLLCTGSGLVVNTLLVGRALSFVPSFIDTVVFIVNFSVKL